MAWTATLNDLQARDGRLVYSVFYTDGVSQKVVREYITDTLTPASLKQTAMAEIARLSVVDTVKDTLAQFKIGQPIDVTPDVPPAPDPAALAQIAFLQAWRSYQGALRAVAAGYLAPDDPLTVAPKGFLPAYLEFL